MTPASQVRCSLRSAVASLIGGLVVAARPSRRGIPNITGGCCSQSSCPPRAGDRRTLAGANRCRRVRGRPVVGSNDVLPVFADRASCGAREPTRRLSGRPTPKPSDRIGSCSPGEEPTPESRARTRPLSSPLRLRPSWLPSPSLGDWADRDPAEETALEQVGCENDLLDTGGRRRDRAMQAIATAVVRKSSPPRRACDASPTRSWGCPEPDTDERGVAPGWSPAQTCWRRSRYLDATPT
jgi:hypothetical protein